MSELHKKLSEIQKTLKAPKNQFNKFGQYHYRSCEDIVEAVKPLLGDCYLVVGDEVVLIGDRYYIKATATLSDGAEKIENSAFAREPEDKKGMDSSQITGTASSYARKYALNGLFAIDDTKDSDFVDDTENKEQKPANATKTVSKPVSNLTAHCSIHDTEMTERISPKTGNPYFAHPKPNGEKGLCFGTKEDQPKLAALVMPKKETETEPASYE